MLQKVHSLKILGGHPKRAARARALVVSANGGFVYVYVLLGDLLFVSADLYL
jgi:hypothetical protein